MQKDKIQGRAPIPGAGIAPNRRSRPRAAVKAEWARWSTCHLSWPSMPMPGAVAALGTPWIRGGQVSSGHPPESNQDLRYPEEARSPSLEMAAPKHTRRASPRPCPRGCRFPQNLPFDVEERQPEEAWKRVLQRLEEELQGTFKWEECVSVCESTCLCLSASACLCVCERMLTGFNLVCMTFAFQVFQLICKFRVKNPQPGLPPPPPRLFFFSFFFSPGWVFFPRSRSVSEATFIAKVWAQTLQGPGISSGRRNFWRLPGTTFPRSNDCWGVI
ncbi:uncharacterized protein [Molothrus aeneus]|uniref:uncharacterized protein isoform X1 n=1 Tax=Molothrus aeneus TaxID=84833 RepID=UPI0034593C84